jgi:hypothetical protein
MSSSSFDSDMLFAMLRGSIPTFLGWCFALFFCLLRRRENPKGATFLGLAVLVTFGTLVLSFGWYYFMALMPDLLQTDIAQYFFIGFRAVCALAFWILVITAVFARPTHYDYAGGSPFEDDPS